MRAVDPRNFIFLRRNDTYASTLLSSALDSTPHTFAMSMSFDTTCPAFAMSTLASENSL